MRFDLPRDTEAFFVHFRGGSCSLIGFAAFFWSCVLFMPVGMNYLALLLLATAMLIERSSLAERWSRLRRHTIWWPLVVFLGWAAFVLLMQETWFAETPSNAVHIARIAITLMLAVSLDRQELRWALAGFALAIAWTVCLFTLHAAVGLPLWPVWAALLTYASNKSIANALLVAMVSGAALLSIRSLQWRRFVLPLTLSMAGLAVLVFVLPNRTALLAMLLGLVAAGAHMYRSRPQKIVLWLLALSLACLIVLNLFPSLKDRVFLGFADLQKARDGIGEPNQYGSWSIRVLMYKTTFQMMLESPWLGNGIGAWNFLWTHRVPAALAGYNMPHNDFLWMGAQAGWVGLLSYAWLLVTGLWLGWRNTDSAGTGLVFVSVVVVVAVSFNSATRDAQIGLALLWVLGLFLNLGQQPPGALRRASNGF